MSQAIHTNEITKTLQKEVSNVLSAEFAPGLDPRQVALDVIENIARNIADCAESTNPSFDGNAFVEEVMGDV